MMIVLFGMMLLALTLSIVAIAVTFALDVYQSSQLGVKRAKNLMMLISQSAKKSGGIYARVRSVSVDVDGYYVVTFHDGYMHTLTYSEFGVGDALHELEMLEVYGSDDFGFELEEE